MMLHTSDMQKNKSKISNNGLLVLSLIIVIYIVILLIRAFSSINSAFDFFIRLFALWGYLSLSIAVMMTPFLKEIYKIFGRPFIKIHHVFAFLGLILITFHPIFFSIISRTTTVFIPSFASWYDFLLSAGRPALIILFIALIAVLFRKKFKSWRLIHALMYLMLILGFVHGLLIGTDFDNKAIIIIYSLLFAGAIASFVVKRVQLYKSLKNKQSKAIKK